MRTAPRFSLAAALLLAAGAAAAVESTPESIEDRAVARCRVLYGDLGPYLFKACIDKDWTAYQALLHYPEEALPALNQCAQHNRQYGWFIVKTCVDQYLEAQRR